MIITNVDGKRYIARNGSELARQIRADQPRIAESGLVHADLLDELAISAESLSDSLSELLRPQAI